MFEDKKGLVFIVDISGYSQFIRELSPNVGISVIRHLLQGIIESNFLSFKISEIEGDAILFYYLGVPPSVKNVLKQFDQMLCNNTSWLTTDELVIILDELGYEE